MKLVSIMLSLCTIGLPSVAIASKREQVKPITTDIDSSDKRPSTLWRFIGDGKTSPIPGIKFQKEGYTCKARRLTSDGSLIGAEVEVQSMKQSTVGSILKKTENALGLPRVYDESSGNIQNIGTSLPVYRVLSSSRKQDYLAACAIWVGGKVLYLGNPTVKPKK